MPSEQKRAFLVLDGLRGAAALMVVTRHAPLFFESISLREKRPGGTAPIGPFWSSYLAVDFFFVLSGFVLAYAYEKRLKSGALSLLSFMTTRVIRLYPLYLLGFSISLVSLLNSIRHGVSTKLAILEAIFAILFVPNPLSEWAIYPLNYPAWSLLFELIGNAAYKIIARFLNPVVLISIITIFGFLQGISVHYEFFQLGIPGNGPLDSGFQWPGVGAGLLRVTYSFFAGVGVFRLWQTGRFATTVRAELIFIALFLSLVAHPPLAWQPIYDLGTVWFIFPVIVFLGSHALVSNFLGKLCAFGGASSYAVYVLQDPIYRFISLIMAHFDFSESALLMLGFLFVVGMFLLAWFAHVNYDEPVRKRLNAAILERLRTARA